jgi:pyruvate-formate lyase
MKHLLSITDFSVKEIDELIATAKDIKANPEKYRDLQIRVCGWNVLWNNINKEEQDGFIRQAEALV